MKTHSARKHLPLAALLALLLGGPLAAQEQDVQWNPPRAEEMDKAAAIIQNRGVPAEPQSLVFAQRRFDFGTVQDGTTVEATFEFSNDSDTSITIVDVHSSCGCTAATPSKTTYDPGESGSISAKFNTTNRLGHQIKYVTLTTDEPDNPRYTLEIAGDVISDLFLSPKALSFGDLNVGQEATVTVDLINVGGDEVKIISAVSTRGDLKVEVGKPQPYEEKATGRTGVKTPITVTAPPDLAPGPLSGVLTIRTDAKQTMSSFTAMLRGRVLGDINIEPSQVYFGMLQPGLRAERQARVRLLDDAEFTLDSFELEFEPNPIPSQQDLPNPELDMEVTVLERDERTGTQPMIFALTAPEMFGRLQGNILLHGHAGGKQMEAALPFSAYINRATPPAKPDAGTSEVEVRPVVPPAGQAQAAQGDRVPTVTRVPVVRE